MNLIERIDRNGQFTKAIDGFVYFAPNGVFGKIGLISPHELREIADELDRRNEEWKKSLTEYMDDKKDSSTEIA